MHSNKQKQEAAASTMTTKRALSLFIQGNAWLVEQVRSEATCSCNACFLCAYHVLIEIETQLAAAERMVKEQDETIQRGIDLCDKRTHERDEARAGLHAVQSLIDNSHGVCGLHLNGDDAPWDELLAGGLFQDWLLKFSEAIEHVPFATEKGGKDEGTG